MSRENVIGKKYGRLIVIRELQDRGYARVVFCYCDCGNEKEIYLTNLRSGRTTSCGCRHKEKVRKSSFVHGSRHTRLYSIWTNMKSRCHNSKSTGYENYGGRGIKVCKEWKNDFVTFERWAKSNGYSDDLTIERVDFNLDYSPENCEWIPIFEQSRNRRSLLLISKDGVTNSLKGWCRELGVNYKTVYTHMQRKKATPEEALDTMLEKHKETEQAFKDADERGMW